MKNIIILFGEMGGGKNYWGERFAQDLGYTFFDGDTVAFPEMVEKVTKFKPLTREMIITYVNHLAFAILNKALVSDGLVVAQALYFDEDRKWMESYLTNLGFKVHFKWVKPSFFRNLKQIYSRPNGLRWVLYWLMNKPWFQKPTHNHDVVAYNGR